MSTAKAYANLLIAQCGSKESAISLAGQIISEISLYNSSINSSTAVEVRKNKSNPSGKIISPKGTNCYCSSCKEFIYQTNNDIYEQGMTTEDFINSYNPVSGTKRVSSEDLDEVLAGDNGSMYINCPKCSSLKSLEIIPARVSKKETNFNNVNSGVVSINPSQFS